MHARKALQNYIVIARDLKECIFSKFEVETIDNTMIVNIIFIYQVFS